MYLILCGKSGSGKDTILKRLVKRGFTPIVSLTSRPIREGETNGVEYNFVSRELFESLIRDKKLIEYRTYDTLVGGEPDTWYYGLEKAAADLEHDYVVVLDINGAKSFMEYYGRENCLCEYIMVSDEERTERAMMRGSFDETEWKRRMEADAKDFSFEQRHGVVDGVVFNMDSLSRAIGKVIYDFERKFYDVK